MLKVCSNKGCSQPEKEYDEISFKRQGCRQDGTPILGSVCRDCKNAKRRKPDGKVARIESRMMVDENGITFRLCSNNECSDGWQKLDNDHFRGRMAITGDMTFEWLCRRCTIKHKRGTNSIADKAEKSLRVQDDILYKQCYNDKCKKPWQELNEINFGVVRYNGNGKAVYTSWCRECKQIQNLQLRRKSNPNPNKRVETAIFHKEDGSIWKTCSNENCTQIEKPLNEEYFQTTVYSDGRVFFKAECRDCGRVRNKQTYDADPAKRIASASRSNTKHKDKRKASRKANRKITSAKRRARRRNDPVFKFRDLVSREILRAIKKQSGSKNGLSIETFLHDPIDDMRIHIEALWQHPDNLTLDGKVWMNWKNHGVYNDKVWIDDDFTTHTWNIDHIVPQAILPFDSLEHPNLNKCWCKDNIRPLSAKQNIIDGGTRIRHKQV